VAKSLSSIMSQIERLQKEAASIQSEIVSRVRKDIAKYGLTAEQLFGTVAVAGTGRAKRSNGQAAKSAKSTKSTKPPKYADAVGNTWGGMGKRPEWIRQALAAGKALEEFLIAQAGAPAPARAKAPKPRAKPKAAPRPKTAARKRAPAKSAAPRKPRTKAAAAPAPA